MAIAVPSTRPATPAAQPIVLSHGEALTLHTAVLEREVRVRLDLMRARDVDVIGALEREVDILERLRILFGLVAGIR